MPNSESQPTSSGTKLSFDPQPPRGGGPSSYHFRSNPVATSVMNDASSRMSSDTSTASFSVTAPSPSLSQTSTMGSVWGTSTYRRDRLLKRAARRAQQASDELNAAADSQGNGTTSNRQDAGNGYLNNVHIDQENDLRRGLGFNSNHNITSSSSSIAGSRSLTSTGSTGSANIQDLGLEAEMLGVLNEEDMNVPEEDYVGPADLVDDLEAATFGALDGDGKKKKGGFRLARFGRKKSLIVAGNGDAGERAMAPSFGSRKHSASSHTPSITSSTSSFGDTPVTFPSGINNPIAPKPILKSALKVSGPSTKFLPDSGPSSRDPLFGRGLRRYPSGSTGTSVSSSRSGSYQPSPLGEARSQQAQAGGQAEGGQQTSSGEGTPRAKAGPTFGQVGRGAKDDQGGQRPDVRSGFGAGMTGLGISTAPSSQHNLASKMSLSALPKLNVSFLKSDGSSPSSPTAVPAFPCPLGQLTEHIVHGSKGVVLLSKAHLNIAAARPESATQWTPSLVILTMKKRTSTAPVPGGLTDRNTKRLSAHLHAFLSNERDFGAHSGANKQGRSNHAKQQQGNVAFACADRIELVRLEVTSGTTLLSRTPADADEKLLIIATGGDVANNTGAYASSELRLRLGTEAERSEWILQLQTVIAELSSDSLLNAVTPLAEISRRESFSSPVEPRPGGLKPAPRPIGGVVLAPPVSMNAQDGLLSYEQAIAASPVIGKRPRPPAPARDSMSALSIDWNVPISSMRDATLGTPVSGPSTGSMRYVDPLDGKTYDLPPSIVGAFMANDSLKTLLAVANGSGDTVDVPGSGVARRGSDNSTDSGAEGSLTMTPVGMSVPVLRPIEEDRDREEAHAAEQDTTDQDEEVLTPTRLVDDSGQSPDRPPRPTVLNRASTASSDNTLTFGPNPGQITLAPSHSAGTLSVQTLIMTPPSPSSSQWDAGSPASKTGGNANAYGPDVGSETASQGSGSLAGSSMGTQGSKRTPAWKERARRAKAGASPVLGGGHGEGIEAGLCIMSELEKLQPPDRDTRFGGPDGLESNTTLSRSPSRSRRRPEIADDGSEATDPNGGERRRRPVVRFADTD